MDRVTMSAEWLTVLISFCLLVATVGGFILNSIRTSLSSLWNQHNAEQEKSSNFREDVKSHYMRKDDLEDHISLRLDSINDRMARVESQLEQLQPVMAGLNHSLPSLVNALAKLETKLDTPKQ